MKLICECGNEMLFNEIDKSTNKKHKSECEYGNGDEQYTDSDYSKFEMWAGNDILIIKCQACKKEIWTYC